MSDEKQPEEVSNPGEGDSAQQQMALGRRRFLQLLTAGAAAGFTHMDVLASLAAIPDIQNPLKHYPNRDWEKVYLNQYHYDHSFTWICAPNDTHMCRMRAFVRNGVMTELRC